MDYEPLTFGNGTSRQCKGEIEIKDVSFKYRSNKTVIEDLTLKCKENTMIAFVGRNGSGKSTLFKIIAGLYNLDHGEVRLDGKSIFNYSESYIREKISIVQQEPFMFNRTISENLKLAMPDVSETDIIAVCKQVYLHEHIESLPDKYESVIGDGGIKLSGGERQRLAIARALLKKSKIILFDEYTSALDNEAQALITKVVMDLRGTHTILVISHKLGTITMADEIIVLDEGKIVGKGNHNELLNQSELYKMLYLSEFLPFDEDSLNQEVVC